MVLGPDDSAVRSFISDLKQQLRSEDPAAVGFASSESSMHAFLHSLASERHSLRFRFCLILELGCVDIARTRIGACSWFWCRLILVLSAQFN